MMFRRRKPEPVVEPYVPFQLAESVRLSMYVVACHPEMPDHIRKWIKDWLHGYNWSLRQWLEQIYGPDVLPVVDEMTEALLATQPEGIRWIENQDSFERWEGELRGRSDEGNPGTTAAG